MPTRYWLQYHNYDKHGAPGDFVINTDKESCKEIKKNVDKIYLMVGGTYNDDLADDFGLSESKVANHFVGRRIYFLYEKFTVTGVEFIGQKQFGGQDYEITGEEGEEGEILDPILLSSPEFCKFWNSYRLHGLVCLSELGYKFPELEHTKENFQYRRRLERTKNSKIIVNSEICQILNFLKQPHPRPVKNLQNIREVIAWLQQNGSKEAAQWVGSNRREYLIGLDNGFKPLP